MENGTGFYNKMTVQTTILYSLTLLSYILTWPPWIVKMQIRSSAVYHPSQTGVLGKEDTVAGAVL